MPETSPKKKKSKKELLFIAAMNVIGEHGYGGASVEKIAAKAGVAKGVVYYYFDSKAALAEQLIKSGLEFLGIRFERAITEDMDPEQAITALSREAARQIAKRRDFAKFLLSEMWREDRAWRATLERSIAALVGIFVHQIERGQADGRFRTDIDTAFYAQTLFATFLAGGLNQAVVHPDEEYLPVADELARYMMAGLKKEHA